MLGLTHDEHPLGIAVGLSTAVLVWAEPDGSANVVGTARPGSSSVQIGSRSVPLSVNSKIIRTSKLHHQVKP